MENENHESFPWQIQSAGAEKQELIKEGAIGYNDLQSFMVYQLILPSQELLSRQDVISISGILSCSCGNEIILSTTLGFNGFLDFFSKHLETCPQCKRQIMLTGESTGTGVALKHWLLITHTTNNTRFIEKTRTSDGLPKLRVENNDRTEENVDKSESYGDGNKSNKIIEMLFDKKQLDPNGNEILAIALLYEYAPAPYVWVSPGPDPYSVAGENEETRQLRFLLSKIIPAYQPNIIPGHLILRPETLITGRQLRPDEPLDSSYINPVLAGMLAGLLGDDFQFDGINREIYSALSVSGKSFASGETGIALIVRKNSDLDMDNITGVKPGQLKTNETIITGVLPKPAVKAVPVKTIVRKGCFWKLIYGTGIAFLILSLLLFFVPLIDNSSAVPGGWYLFPAVFLGLGVLMMYFSTRRPKTK